MFESVRLDEDQIPRWVCLKCGRVHYWTWKKDKNDGGYWHEEIKCDGCGWKRK